MEYESHKIALMAEKTRLESELEALGKKLNENGDWVVTPEPIDSETPEFDEIADKTEDLQEKVAILNVIEQQYTDILDALNKIEEGTYGKDEKTGEPIDPERLKAHPAARTNI